MEIKNHLRIALAQVDLIVEVNRKKISNSRQFLAELKKSDKRLLLRVKSERGTFFITLKAD